MTPPSEMTPFRNIAAGHAQQHERVMHKLLTGIATNCSVTDMGTAAEGYLAGIRTALAAVVGPEAAYAVLQRAADETALEIIRNGSGG